MQRKVYLIAAFAVLFLLSACSASQQAEPQATAPEATVADTSAEPAAGSAAESEAASPDEGPTASEVQSEQAEAEAGNGPAGADRPAWQLATLTNARTGETFALADFAGKTVFVEPMATWCTTCRRQLMNVRDARAQLADDVVFVALSVETNIGDGDLANYANGAGFDWLFAVATAEMLEQLVDQFGRAIVNPPATPHFVVRPDGTFTDLVTGVEAPDQIVSQIQAAQG